MFYIDINVDADSDNSVSPKNPPYGFLTFFPKRMLIF